jgi:hypothetical protein
MVYLQRQSSNTQGLFLAVRPVRLSFGHLSISWSSPQAPFRLYRSSYYSTGCLIHFSTHCFRTVAGVSGLLPSSPGLELRLDSIVRYAISIYKYLAMVYRCKACSDVRTCRLRLSTTLKSTRGCQRNRTLGIEVRWS